MTANKTILAKKRMRYFLSEDEKYFVFEVNCSAPMLAIKMHEHTTGRSHTTEVISGAVEIHDGNNWRTTVRAGETIDLRENNLKHEILAIENNTVFRNISPSSHHDTSEIHELINLGLIEELEPPKDRVVRIEKYSYSIENDNSSLLVTVLGSLKPKHASPELSFHSVEENDTCLILSYTCDEGEDMEELIKITRCFPITNTIRKVKLKWDEGRAETIINLFP